MSLCVRERKYNENDNVTDKNGDLSLVWNYIGTKYIYLSGIDSRGIHSTHIPNYLRRHSGVLKELKKLVKFERFC